MRNWAVENVGRDVLIIRGNKVIGKGRSITMSGCARVSIILVDDAAKKLIESDQEMIVSMGYKHCYIRYCPFNGMFIELGWVNEQLNKEFEDTRIVDALNFRFKIVPDDFKDVEGYGARINALRNEDDSNA